ncbi:PREDICTED: AP2/ERF and B3 domain-containing transcription factor At1g50680-like [Lupinus angustifolius]|uniref:AP2/ERF and B3 domain-containing transcription factor At1g50680-like n=1 Tax=Lupinus angustifolius TaxID=3871 RepID=UPI00092EDB7A|nr:PREDICTED: AP2/ERF and B3 domain-containing transcription factor At1g50680-like [Lupinus angustifolius]
MISNSGINGNYETSDSNAMNFAIDAAKRVRYEENARFQKFKGVVPQQNGHWGAQIYANHQRIWLGTFKSEKEAAMAYDSASVKLRSGESHRNFPWNDQTVQEPQFQSLYSTEAVLSMIKDGIYPSKFATFLRTQTQGDIVSNKCENIRMKIHEENLSCTLLFQKELTPSDVGKLNRLVIPKKHAVTYFPYVCGIAEAKNNDIDVDIEVIFYDNLMRSWKFRYCYWKSSQSFVFTRGWNRFVKDKKLKAKDTIAFYVCEPVNLRKGGEAFSLIDIIYYNDDHERKQCFEVKGDAEQGLRNMLTLSDEEEDEKDEDIGQETKDMKDLDALNSPNNSAQKGLRLFGVCIN